MAKPGMKKTKSLHGIENCRAVEIGAERFAECLRQGPNSCSYALPFGYCFLCGHPNLEEIIANTKKARSFASAVKQ